MSDYPRVLAHDSSWIPALVDGPATHKVVPTDAIVIEPDELAVVDTALGATDGTLIAVVTVSDQQTEHLYWTPGQRDPRLMARLYLSIAEHLDARPPVNEALIDPLAEAISDAYGFGDDHAAPYHVARHLLEQGWTKPEPTS